MSFFNKNQGPDNNHIPEGLNTSSTSGYTYNADVPSDLSDFLPQYPGNVTHITNLHSVGFDTLGIVLGIECSTYHTHLNFSTKYWDSRTNSVYQNSIAQRLHTQREMRAKCLYKAMVDAYRLGADGVIDLKFHYKPLYDNFQYEFYVQGTAIKSLGDKRPRQIFTAHCSVQEFTALMHAGYIPCQVFFGYGIRGHFTHQIARTSYDQFEYTSLTQDISRLRDDLRIQARRDAQNIAAEAVVIDYLYADIEHHEVEDKYDDSYRYDFFTSVGSIASTSLKKFQVPDQRANHAPLTIMRL